MELTRALAKFDGKHAEPLRALAVEFDDNDAPELTSLCRGEHAVAATWVVKALLEEGRAEVFDLRQVFKSLEPDAEWGAILHLLQIVRFAPDAALAQVFSIRGLLEHPKTLVQVWAMDAFVRVAMVEQGFLAEARGIIAGVGESDPASMRARARALQKLLDQKSA